MFTQPTNGNTEQPYSFVDMLKTSSRKIIAIGASLTVWLRAVDRIVFTKEPTHTPDPKLIEELTEILLAAETKKPRLND
jgi:hypothetical protein